MREWREHRGLSLTEVAEALGTHRGMVSRYELGRRGLTQDMQFRIMRILQITPAQFFTAPATADLIEKLYAELQSAPPKRRKEIVAALLKLIDRT